MNRMRRRINDERGSASIEFLGMVPYVFLMMVMLWQVVVGAYAFIAVQSAANEAAKVYSITNDKIEAQNAGAKLVSTLQHVVIQENLIEDHSDGRRFRAKISIHLSLVFLPDEFMGMTIPPIPITQTVEGRRI